MEPLKETILPTFGDIQWVPVTHTAKALTWAFAGGDR
jgi:hypothetical protein